MLDQRTPDTEPARFFLHQQQPQLGEFVGRSHQEDRAERLAVCFRNPAMLARRVIVFDELRADLGDQRLVADVPAIFIGIGDGLSRDHPAHVADAMAAQQEGGTRALRRLQQIFDRGHRLSQAAAIGRRKLRQHRADFVLRTAFEGGLGLTPLGGQRKLVLAAIRREWFADDQATLVETLDDSAEVAGIEAEFRPDLLGRRLVAMGEFIEHPRLAQRVGALHQMLVEHPELVGVEAVEGANRRDLAIGLVLGDTCHCQLII